MAVRIQDGSGNSLTSTSDALDVNVKTSSVSLGGGTVTVSNFPATQPVSGAFFQTTQPVFIAAMPTTPVTGTFWPATQPVSIATMPSTPVTGTVAVSNLPATQPVSGTFFQATQPVSAASLPLPAGAALETGGNLAAIVTNIASGTQKSQVNDPTSFTGANVSAKGVQPTNSLGVQQPKDSGRSKVILSSVRVTSITTEALLTLTQKKGDATTTTGTSYTVTAGKTLRIQAIKLHAQLTTAATAAWVSCRLREGAASGGAVSTTSDIVAIAETNTIAVTDVIGMGPPSFVVDFPDGLEIAGGQNIGISELALNVDLAVTVVLMGYEY